uniref:Alpha/beta hydrolase fold protein n=1 Tax=uncultured bacterium BLR5 TaxID=506522 RepID=C0INW7_9BACT|nr:alpha/beta hydrolase fold protein [uncultured bacterium BLR5]
MISGRGHLVVQLFSLQPYLISWIHYDPSKEIGKLRIPVLIVQGTTDIQTRLEDANGLANANAAARRLLIEGMNHVLKNLASEMDKQVSSYSDPTLPVSPDLINSISDFVKQKQKAKSGELSSDYLRKY